MIHPRSDLVKGSNFFRSKKFDRKFDRKVRSFELFENIKSSNDRTFSNSKKFDHSNFLKNKKTVGYPGLSIQVPVMTALCTYND